MRGTARLGRLSKILNVVIWAVFIAIASWVVGYAYLVEIAGFPSAGFFTVKMAIGLFAASFTIFGIFRLRGFFKRPPR